MRLEINMEEFVSITKKYFKDEDIQVIMEIGSLDGKDSIYFKNCFPNSKVYCIEGLPENYEKYLRHQTTVTPINAVIADYDGQIIYHKKNVNGIHGIFNRGDQYGNDKLDLKCMTVQTLCKKHKIQSIDLIKIDVEGATYEVLNGMGDMINNIKIMHIETESYPFFEFQKLDKEVFNFLINKNFTMIDKTSVDINKQKQHDSVWINNKFLP
jgi:FkbM family methyltransferase